jgi:hypothetical protein
VTTPAPTAAPWTPRRPDLTAFGFLALWIAILSLPLWSGQFLAGPWSDQHIAGYAIRYWGAEQWRATGHPPLWNPEMMGGVPVFAGFGDLFYPTAWLRLVLPTVTAMNLAFVVHYLVAGIALYLLLRMLDFSWLASVVGGTAYQLSGVIATYVSPGHDGKLFVTAMFPVMLIGLVLGIRRRRWEGHALLGLAVGLALLSPQYQATQYSLLASGLFALYLTFGDPQGLTARQRWTGLLGAAAAVALGFGLALVQVLPFTHYIPHSSRAESAGYEWSSSFGIPWIHVPELVLAGFAGSREAYFGPNGLKLHSEYLGLPVVALAILGLGSPRRRLVKWFAAIAVLFLLVALGGATPFYRLWYALVPYVNKARAPGIALFVVSLTTAVLAGCGVERLERREGRQHAVVYLVTAAVLALLAVVGTFGAIAQSYAAAHPDLGNTAGVSAAQAAAISQEAIRWGALGSAIALAAVAAITLSYLNGRLNAPAFAVLIVLLVGADLWRSARGFWQWSRPEQQEYARDAVIDRVKQAPLPYRVLDPGVYSGTMLMRHDIPQLLGYHGFELRYFDDLLNKNAGWRNALNPQIWKLFAVRFIILTDTLRVPGYHRILGPVNTAAGRPAYLYEADSIPPYARVIPAVAKAAPAEIIPTLLDPRMDFNRLSLIDTTQHFNPLPVTSMPAPSPSRATVDQWTPGKMSITITPAVPAGSSLLVAENWYKDWEAVVDGRPAEVLRADGSLILVVLPEGARHVDLVFAPRDYQRGLRMTWVSLLVLVAGLVGPPVARRWRRRG